MTSLCQKYNLPELSFILHYRKDSEDRESNLRKILDYLHVTFPESEKIIVNDDNEFENEELAWVEEYGSLYFFENADHFKKSSSYNRGVKYSSGKVLCFWDVDVLIRPDYINMAYLNIERRRADHIYPFNGTFIDIQKCLFSKIENFDFTVLENLWEEKDENLHLSSTESPGGCNLISRDAFDKIGGYDERFIGWGFEDTDYFQRSGQHNILGRLTDPKAICWHLHHDQATRTENPYYQHNLQIYNANRFL